MILDSDFVIRAANITFARFFDVSHKTLIGKPIASLIDPKSQDELYFAMQEFNRQGKSEARVVKFAKGNNVVYANLICNGYEYMGQQLIRAVFVNITKEYLHRELAEEELKKKNEQYELAIMGSSAGIWDWDIQSDYIVYSKLFSEQLGYQEDEMPHQISSLINLIHPDEKDITLELVKRCLQNLGGRLNTELRFLYKGGNYRWFRIRGQALMDQDGNCFRMAGSIDDINEQKELESALRHSEEKYRLITENISDVICVYAIEQKRFSFFSPSIQSLLGYSIAEAMTKSTSDILKPEDFDMLTSMLTQAQKKFADDLAMTYDDIIELQLRHKTGLLVWIEMSIKIKFNNQHELELLGVMRNIDKRKIAELEVDYLIHHDSLTGIFNRHYFDQRVIEEMERAERYNESLSMILFDLDRFKLVNDNWGHPVGDAVLRQTAGLIKSMIRKVDIFARLGGEEFVILMPQTTKNGAFATAEKIRIAMENNHNPLAGVVTISLGLAERNSGETFMNFYKRTDDALYEAKGSGRNKTVIAADSISSMSAAENKWNHDWDSGDLFIDNQHKSC